MTEKITDNFHYVWIGLAIMTVVLICYGLGSQTNKNKLCNENQGVYVKTWNGYKCIHATEIEL